MEELKPKRDKLLTCDEIVMPKLKGEILEELFARFTKHKYQSWKTLSHV